MDIHKPIHPLGTVLWTSSGHEVDAKHIKLFDKVGRVVNMASTRLEVPLSSNIDPKTAAQYFERMLRCYGDSNATLPHDKIYGLLGLSDAFWFPNSYPPPIDYH